MHQTPLIHGRAAKSVTIIIGFMLLLPACGWAQAVLGLSATQATAVRTGQTELLGSILFTVNSGVTVADTLQIDLSPAVIANPTNGITLTATGGLAGASIVSVAAAAGIIRVSIPAGAAPGATLTISGIRTSIPDLNGLTTLDARVTLNSSNTLGAQQTSARVLNGVTEGILVDPMSDTAFTVVKDMILDPLGEFVFTEATPNAFSSAVGTLGQTQATQVIFQLVGLPDGVSVSFPSTIIGLSGATLTSVNADAITNQTTPARKVYNFTDSAGGNLITERFAVAPTINAANGLGSATVFLQVGMGPIGGASNVVPRYAEEFLPPLPGSPIIIRTLVFPTSTDTRIVVSNVSSGTASLTVRGRDNAGNIITGAGATLSLPPRQTMALAPADLFPGVNLSSLATVEVESQTRRIVASSLDRRSTSTSVLPFIDELRDIYLPFDRRTSIDVPILSVLNTGRGPAELTLTLRSSTGQVLGTTSRSIPQAGLLREPLTTLFSVQSGGFGLNGYLLISTTRAVRASLVNHPAMGQENVFGVAPVSEPGIPIPFYAFGGSYSTTLSLINGSASVKAHFTLRAFQPSGAPLAGATPFTGDVNPGERLDLDLARIFGSNLSSISTGYLRLTVDPISPGPVSGPPPLAGLVRISAANASSTYPVIFNPAGELFFGPTVDSGTDYTGIAVLNPSMAAAEVTAELIATDGTSRTTTFTLGGGVLRSQLLRELFPGSSGQNGVLRIASSQALFAVGFRGSLMQSDLVYLHAQTAPQ